MAKAATAIDKKLADPNFALWSLISNTRHAMLQATRKEYAPLNITPGQANVLRLIYNLGEKATFAEISRQAFRTMHTLSARITRMEEKGLLKKIRDIPGTALIRFELTEKGIKAYEFSEKRESMKRILSVLSDKERQELSSCLTKILAEAEKF